MDDVTINGLRLPDALVTFARKGRWSPPEAAVLERVFGDRPDHPQFYSLDYMPRENAGWLRQSDPVYFGKPSTTKPPGDIDNTRSVLIGDLGPDLPIALDYRTDPPRVLYLGKNTSLWIEVAKDFDQLCERLGL